MRNEEDVRKGLRDKCVAEIPGWYSPWVHLLFPAICGLSLIIFAITQVHAPRWWELLAIPLVWLISNATEWRAHKHVLHKRTWYAPVLYDRHTPIHHRIYLTDDMAIRSTKEFRLVLIPAYGVLLLFAGTVPIAAALWLAGHHNLAAIFLATSTSYVLSYEWLHLAYHAPEDSPIGRLKLIRALKRHHAIHHHPDRMQKWNFNVVVPLWDYVRGTVYRGASNSDN